MHVQSHLKLQTPHNLVNVSNLCALRMTPTTKSKRFSNFVNERKHFLSMKYYFIFYVCSSLHVSLSASIRHQHFIKFHQHVKARHHGLNHTTENTFFEKKYIALGILTKSGQNHF